MSMYLYQVYERLRRNYSGHALNKNEMNMTRYYMKTMHRVRMNEISVFICGKDN